MADHRLQIVLAAKDITGTALTKFKGRLGAITKSVFSLQGAIGTLAGTGGFGLLVTQSLKAADQIGKTADKLGLSTTSLQEYQYAANQSGVTTETLNMALQRFTRRTAEAAQGKGELKDVLKQYNIAVKDAAGNTRRTEDMLADLADVIQNTESRSERLRIAFKAFDSEGAALVNMLKNGSAGLDGFRDKAQRLGLVIDEGLIRNSEKASDELNTLVRVIKTRVTSTVVNLAPEITRVTNNVLGWVEANKELIDQNVAGAIDKTARAVGGIVSVYQSLPGDVVGAAGAGVVGRVLFGSWGPAKIAVGLATINEALKFYGMGVRDTVKDFEEFSEAINNIWNELAGNKPGVGARPSGQKAWSQEDIVSGFYTGGGFGGASASTPIPATQEPKPPTKVTALPIETDYSVSALEGNRFRQAEIIQRDALERMTESSGQAYEEMSGHVTAYYDNVAAQNQKMLDGVSYMADSMSSAVADFATTGKFNFTEFANSIIYDLIRIEAKTALTSIFTSLGSSSELGGSIFAAFASNAKGGVYNTSGAVPFARGGIVNQPTVFPFAGGAGLMGEAGPEAILPLSRTSGGDLGVKTSGGGGVTIQNMTMINGLYSMDSQDVYRTLVNSGAVEAIVTDNLNGNGSLRHAILENL